MNGALSSPSQEGASPCILFAGTEASKSASTHMLSMSLSHTRAMTRRNPLNSDPGGTIITEPDYGLPIGALYPLPKLKGQPPYHASQFSPLHNIPPVYNQYSGSHPPAHSPGLELNSPKSPAADLNSPSQTCVCYKIFKPVCGRGKTYSNDCLAKCEGVDLFSYGACAVPK